MITIILVDDQPLFRMGLKKLLELEPGFSVVADVACGEEAIRQASVLRPDVIVADLILPDMSGFDLAEHFAATGLDTPRIVAMSAYASTHTIERAIRAGACAYVSKMLAARQITDAIRQAVAGDCASNEGSE